MYLFIIVLLVVIVVAIAWRVETMRKRRLRKMVHDLRTRLAIMKTNSEVHLLDHYIDENTKKILHSIIDEVNIVNNILNDLR